MSEWRYIAQRARTGEFLEWDLPLTRDELTWALSGAGSLRGTLSPEVGGLTAADGLPLLDEWGTLIYAEASGRIRWGGIVVSSSVEGQSWAVEAASFATYPHGLPYLGNKWWAGVNPETVIEHLWDAVQSAPGGDLGVVLSGSAQASPVRLGIPGEPYQLFWWEAPDIGSEIDAVCDEARIEFRETHEWIGDTEQIEHRIEYAYPRLGKRRTDLAFISGENIIEPVAPTRSGDDYANGVVGIGAGEGDEAVRTSVPGDDDGRLRRVTVYTDKGISSKHRLTTFARRELARLSRTLEIPSITVRDHGNAPIGSWDLGDDIQVEAEVPHLGMVSMWCRITGWSLVDDVTAQLTLARSDSFVYGA